MSTGSPFYPRIAAVATIFATLTAALSGRLVWLGLVSAGGVVDVHHFEIPAPRGTIWDRDGALLATDTFEYEVGLDLASMRRLDMAELALELGPLLDLHPGEVIASAKLAEEQGLRWTRLHSGVDMTKADLLEAYRAKGLTLESRPRRVYPLGADTTRLLGMVNLAYEASHGVEAAYDDVLKGRSGVLAGYAGTNPSGFEPAQPGTDLRLTIDRGLQVAAARALETRLQEEEAERGVVLVLDAKTGAVLASVSAPSFDANDFTLVEPGLLNDPTVSAIYEPGSVIKAFTVAAGVDAGVIDEDSHYQDEGMVEYAGLSIPNWDHLPHGWTSVADMLRFSLNVGAVWVADQMGQERFYGSFRAFGFGQLTGIDLSGEVEGIVHWPDEEDDWYEGNLATNSFGHGLSTTPMQVASAMQALANDGLLMRPYVVEERIPSLGPAIRTEPTEVRQVVGHQTSRTLRELLQNVVDDKVTQAAIPGYSVAGKTGTSQIPIAGGYDEEGTIASFCGFLPVGDPRVVILTIIERPKAIRGSDAAAPLFRSVAEAAIATLDIAPDRALVGGGEVTE